MKISAIVLVIALTLACALHAQSSNQLLPTSTKESQIDHQPPGYREIHTDVLSKLIRSANPLVMIVDARGVKTDDGKRIPSAKAIPSDATIDNITANLPDKEAIIVVYCANAQCTESGWLADRLFRMGYKNVWKYVEGLEGWEKSGQKVEQGKTAAESATETGPKSA